jgi:hypothetical protein
MRLKIISVIPIFLKNKIKKISITMTVGDSMITHPTLEGRVKEEFLPINRP